MTFEHQLVGCCRFASRCTLFDQQVKLRSVFCCRALSAYRMSAFAVIVTPIRTCSELPVYLSTVPRQEELEIPMMKVRFRAAPQIALQSGEFTLPAHFANVIACFGKTL